MSLNPQYWVHRKFSYSDFCTDNPSIINKKPLFSKLDIKTTFIERNIFSKEFLEENSELNIERFIKIKPEELDHFFTINASMQKKSDKSPRYEVKIKDFVDAHFMHEVIKRFINNLNIYRNNKLSEDELFIHYMQRCVLILINAVAACERQNLGKVAFQNIAILENFDIAKIRSSDNAYNINIAPFIDKPGSFTYLLFKHPLISYILELKKSPNKSLDSKVTTFTELKVSLTRSGIRDDLTASLNKLSRENSATSSVAKELLAENREKDYFAETSLQNKLRFSKEFKDFKHFLEIYIVEYPENFKRKLEKFFKGGRTAVWLDTTFFSFCKEKDSRDKIIEILHEYGFSDLAFSLKHGFESK